MLDEGRAGRWRRRRDASCLDNGKPGAVLHGLRPEEVTAILGSRPGGRDLVGDEKPLSIKSRAVKGPPVECCLAAL